MKLFLFLMLSGFSWTGFALENVSIQAIQQRASQYTNEVQQLIRQNQPESIETHARKVSSIIVFLSFSMPKQSLDGWLSQCKRYGATPVIRGLIHNSFKETLPKIADLSRKTGTGMQLDPVLFQTFGITQVPAVVRIKNQAHCPAMMNCPISFDRMYGDVSLDYALTAMNEGGQS